MSRYSGREIFFNSNEFYESILDKRRVSGV